MTTETTYQGHVIYMNPSQLAHLAVTYHNSDFPGRRPATIHFSKLWINKWISWMKACHHYNITSENLQTYCTRLFENHKPRTAQEYWNSVRRFLRWLETTGRVNTSPHHAVRTPTIRDERSVNAITYEEYIKLRHTAAGHWMDWVILLGWNTGMSIADCMMLRWGDIDMDKCFIRIRRVKTGTESIIPFNPTDELGRALQALRAESPTASPTDFVSDQAGSRVNMDRHVIASSGSDAFRYIADKAGIDRSKRFHSLRHSFVSMLANSGMSTILATKVSGHLDPRIFSQYVHVDTDAIRQGVSEARVKAGNMQEITVVTNGQRVSQSGAFTFKPERIYIVKKGRINLPDGEPVQFVKTLENAEGKRAVTIPCDERGEPTCGFRLVVDIRDVNVFS